MNESHQSPHLILWGVGTTRTIRPHWVLHELGLEYESVLAKPRRRSSGR